MYDYIFFKYFALIYCVKAFLEYLSFDFVVWRIMANFADNLFLYGY